MAKTKISEYDSTSANNTDVDSINIAEGCAPSGINNAIREVMAHLKDFQTGASGDSLTVGGTLTSGTVDINGGAIDGATVGATTPSTGSFTNLTASGTVTIPDNAISGDKVEGGTINAITINTLTAGQANFADNAKAIFGAGSDLQIYHNPALPGSLIEDVGSGDLIIKASNQIRFQDGSSNHYAIFNEGTSVDLYYNNALKLATTSTGIDVTGTVVSDGLTVDGTAKISDGVGTLILEDNNQTAGTKAFGLSSKSGDLYIRSFDDTYTTATERFSVDHATGDISFYEDTGTTAKFFWDASAERLEVGGNAQTGGRLYLESGAATSFIRMYCTAGTGGVHTIQGSGSNGLTLNITADQTLELNTNGAERLRIDSSGNLGLGVTPSAWQSGRKAIQVGARGALSQNLSGGILVSNNWFNDGANKYIVNGYSQLYFQAETGNHEWFTAPSGTAGAAISFTQAMTLDASGRLGIGVTSPLDQLHIAAPTATIRLEDNSGTSNYGLIRYIDGRLILDADKSNNQASSTIEFIIDGSERARITSAGELLVGTTSSNPISAADDGIAISGGGYILASRASNNSAAFDRRTTDGDIVKFYKDGTTVGSIRSFVGDTIIGNAGTVGIRFDEGSGYIPWNMTTNAANDNALDIGASSARFKNLYLSGGVYVGGTAAANHLDDYEEGTFTPIVIGGASAGTGTYTDQLGTYTKVGNVVHVRVYLAWTAHTGSGQMRFAGFPFTSVSAGTAYSAMAIGYYNNIAIGAGAFPSVHMKPSSTEAYIGSTASGGGAWGNLTVDAAGGIVFSGSYQVG